MAINFYQRIDSESVLFRPLARVVPTSDPAYQEWLAEGNTPDPCELDWAWLYASTIDPNKLLPVFLRIKAISKQNLAVNTSFTTLIPTLTATKIEAALAVAIHELAKGLEAIQEDFTESEKTLWNAALTDSRFATNSPARL